MICVHRCSSVVPSNLSKAPRDAPAFGALREGAPLVAALAALAAVGLARHRAAGAGLLGLAAGSAWFFRDPPRRCPGTPGTLYSAADGRVIAVGEVEWDWFIKGTALRIATFLSPLDVHVNRSPAAARLVAYRRDPGGFVPAFLAGRSAGNARQLLGLEVDRGSPLPRGEGAGTNRVVVAQIAGLLARRTVLWRLPGDHLAAGQKLGMIRFGSRTDVLVPTGLATPLVSRGDRVRASLTPIARYRSPVMSDE